MRRLGAHFVSPLRGLFYIGENEVRAVLESELPVHLIAGARSADGWDVPDWANDLCTTRVNIPRTGHLMMAENPRAFARAVETVIGLC